MPSFAEIQAVVSETVNKMDWDQPLTDSLLDEWNSLVEDLQVDISVSIPRCYLDGIGSSVTSLTLCGFCDASTKGLCGRCVPGDQDRLWPRPEFPRLRS